MVAAEVARREFAHGFRGYQVDEVRAYLREVALELDRAENAVLELRSDLAAARDERPVSREELTERLGGEAARVLSAAEDSATEIRARAEQRVEKMLRQARADAAQLKSEAERDAAALLEGAEERRSELDRELAEERQRADHEAARVRAEAIESARDMLAEAKIARRQMLVDLAERRQRSRRELAQLRAGIEQLQESYDELRSLLDGSTRVIDGAVDAARQAAVDAADHFDRTDDEDDLAVASAALAGTPGTSDQAEVPAFVRTGLEPDTVVPVEHIEPAAEVGDAGVDVAEVGESFDEAAPDPEEMAPLEVADTSDGPGDEADSEPEPDPDPEPESEIEPEPEPEGDAVADVEADIDAVPGAAPDVGVLDPDPVLEVDESAAEPAAAAPAVDDAPHAEVEEASPIAFDDEDPTTSSDGELPDVLDDGEVPAPSHGGSEPPLLGPSDRNIDELFARIRSSRDGAVSAAREVLAGDADAARRPAAAEDAVGAGVGAVDTPAPEVPRRPFVELPDAAERVSVVASTMKRALNDQLNEVLDALRQAKLPTTVDELLGPDARGSVGAATADALTIGLADPDVAVPAGVAVIDDLLGGRLVEGLDAALSGDPDEAAVEVRRHFKELRRRHVDDVARAAAAAAHDADAPT